MKKQRNLVRLDDRHCGKTEPSEKFEAGVRYVQRRIQAAHKKMEREEIMYENRKPRSCGATKKRKIRKKRPHIEPYRAVPAVKKKSHSKVFTSWSRQGGRKG